MPFSIHQIKEGLIKPLYRHAGEYQHPVNNCFDWILAYARMTTQRISGLIQSFLNIYPRLISGLLLICIATPVAAAPGRILDKIEVEQADTNTFASEAQAFKSIGLSIALSIARCQGQEGCEPVVDRDELDILIGKLDDRINRLVIKHQDGAPEYSDVLTAYVNQRESYLEYQKKLEALSPSVDMEAEEEMEITDTLEEQPAGEAVDLSVFEDVDEALFDDADQDLENLDPDLGEDLGEEDL